MRIYPIAVLICLPLWLAAQPDPVITQSQKGLEYGVSQAEMIDQLMFTMPGLGSTSREMLVEQNIKPYMMPPRDKGLSGSANCYILSACLEFYINYDNNYKVNLSPDYIDLNIPSENMIDGLVQLIQDGTVNAAIMPYGARTISSGVQATSHYKVVNYLHIFRKESGRTKVFETRKALMRGNPVVVELRAPADFPQFKDKVWVNAGGKADQLYPVLVVGYQEEMEALEILGPWGTKWGRGGYCWLKYADFEKMAENGYVFVPEESYSTTGR